MNREYSGYQNTRNLYSSLANISVPTNLPSCLNRNNAERTQYDINQYNQFVLGKTQRIAPVQISGRWIKNDM